MCAIKHFAAEKDYALVFSTLLDEVFRAAQTDVLKSVEPALADLRYGIELAFKLNKFLELLQCTAAYRRAIQAGNLSKAVYGAMAAGNFAAAAETSAVYAAGPKSNSAWLFALRCYLIWEAAAAANSKAVTDLIGVFNRQLGLRYHGVATHTARLCEAMMAQAAEKHLTLAEEAGLDPEWLSSTSAQVKDGAIDDATELKSKLEELATRTAYFRMTVDENPSLVEFIDEERTAEFTVRLEDAMIQVARTVEGRSRIDQIRGLVRNNPYPRYRDNALVAVGVASLRSQETSWTRQCLQDIIATGLDNEGITFTFDLAAQLAAESGRRGLPPTDLTLYLRAADSSSDRWGSALRAASALAAAEFSQARTLEATTLLEGAAKRDQGFAGYMAAHLLHLACRWCEFGEPARAAALGLIQRSRQHAGRVRDPSFRDERLRLVDEFSGWFDAPSPMWPEVSALLRATPDPDARRIYKDLVSARWYSSGKWSDWDQLVLAVLADGTALDMILARLFAEVLRRHRAGVLSFPDSQLLEAIKICGSAIAPIGPWEASAPAYG